MTWTNWAEQPDPARPASSRRRARTRWLRRCAARSRRARACARPGAGHSFTPVDQTGGTILDTTGLRGVTDDRRRAPPGHGAAGHDRRRVRRSALGGRPRARQPGRHRHAGHRGGDRDRHARIGQPRCRASRPRCAPAGSSTATASSWRSTRRQPGLLRAAQVAVGMLGVMTSVTIEACPAYRLSRAHRALAVRGRARALGRALRRAPPLLVLLAAERGLGRALRPGHAAGPADDRHLLRQGLRRGRRRRCRRPRLRAAASTAATASTRRLRAELPRARVLRAAGARPRGGRGDARADAGEPARRHLPARGAHDAPPTTRYLSSNYGTATTVISVSGSPGRTTGPTSAPSTVCWASSARACTGGSCTS